MALLFACGSVSAQREETASMRIDIRKKAGDISPLVFGQFIEHLGRSITGGIYEEGSPLSDSPLSWRNLYENIPLEGWSWSGREAAEEDESDLGRD
jgi:hypothetical protein